jgi:hypothetical protein
MVRTINNTTATAKMTWALRLPFDVVTPLRFM